MFELLIIASFLTEPDFAGYSPVSSATDEQDQEVLRSARHYRIQVYRTFRTDRPEFDRRRSAASEVLQGWTAAGRNPQDSEAVVRWFEEALERSTANDTQPLPEPPTFAAAASSPAVDAFNQQPATIAAPGDSPAFTGSFDTGLDPSGPNDAGFSPDGPALDVYTTTGDPGSASRSNSPLTSLQRALWKAAASLSQETEPELDALPDWPSPQTH